MPKSPSARQRQRNSEQHTLTWKHPLTGKTHVLHLTVTEDYLAPGTTHLEIQSGKTGHPNPISATGYRSHFIDAGELTAAGGVMAYVLAWINRELPAFRQQELRNRQTSLFDWADAQSAATAKSASSRKSARPTPRPQRKRRAAPARGPR